MTETLANLLARPAGAISAEFIGVVLEQRLGESLTLEFKEKAGPTLLASIAAMANSYGGLILVGVRNDGSVPGVPEDVEVTVSNLCFNKLEPPVVPDLALVRGVGPENASVLAIRVDPSRLPVPLVVDGKVHVRLQGRNAPADRSRMRELFSTGGRLTTHPLGSPQVSPSRWHPPGRMADVPTFVVRAVLRLATGGTHLPPVDTELRRTLQGRLADSSIVKWRKEQLRNIDRGEAARWVVSGTNSSTEASFVLDAPEGDSYVPRFRAIVAMPDSPTSGSCHFLFDSILQDEILARPVDEFIGADHFDDPRGAH